VKIVHVCEWNADDLQMYTVSVYLGSALCGWRPAGKKCQTCSVSIPTCSIC